MDARAQDDEPPLRLAFINVAGEPGANAYSTVQGILLQSSQIILVTQPTFMAGASRYNLGLDVFRQGSAREENEANIRELMKSLDVEAIVIQDVFGKGGKLQMVVMGPRGRELRDLRRDIRKGRVTDDQAIDLLKEVFSTLVPEVRSYREEQDEKARQAELEAQRALEEDKEEVSIRDQVIAERSVDSGDLQTGYQLNVGAMMGHRLMRLSGEDGFEFNHGTPFVGVGGNLDARFATFSEGSGAAGLNIFGGYAPFKTAFYDAMLDSSFARVGAELYVVFALTSDFLVRAYGGGEALSITLGQNELYTGHRYISARTGAGVEYLFGELATLKLGAGILPILKADNSHGAYGEVDARLGFEGAARLEVSPIKAVTIALDYTAQYYSLGFPAPTVLATPAATTDLLHMIVLSLGYRM